MQVGVLERLPADFEVRENTNGQVSVRRRRIAQITPAEAQLALNTISRLRPNGYRVHIGDRCITILASAQDHKSFSSSVDAEFADGFAAALEEMFARRYGPQLAAMFRAKRLAHAGLAKNPRFYPLLRFQLADKMRRIFWVARIYFSGDQDWLQLEKLSLPAALMKYAPHLGRDSFFDLL